jgi:ADP-ribose pyrophosphatase
MPPRNKRLRARRPLASRTSRHAGFPATAAANAAKRRSRGARTKTTTTVQSRRRVFTGRAFDLTVERLIEPGGRRVVREIVRHGPSAVILAMDGRGNILLVRQYRHAAAQKIWELSAGGVEAGERPAAAARRELREETGFAARNWRLLCRFFPSPGFLDEEMFVYLASELEAGKAAMEPDENIELRFFSPAEVKRLIRSGVLKDGKTLAALACLSCR